MSDFWQEVNLIWGLCQGLIICGSQAIIPGYENTTYKIRASPGAYVPIGDTDGYVGCGFVFVVGGALGGGNRAFYSFIMGAGIFSRS